MALSAFTPFPQPSQEELRSRYVGSKISTLPVPSVILDRSKIQTNSDQMLETVKQLGLSFRAHVKTHKTSEVTRMQVGPDCKDVRLIVSTVMEAEGLTELCLDYKSRGASINILYGVPVGPSAVDRLASLAQKLGPGSISFMIDNSAHLASVQRFKSQTGFPVSVFIKTDSGYHRAGIAPDSSSMIDLVKQVSELEQSSQVHLLGFYSHNSLSYNGDRPDDAMAMLEHEIQVCKQASEQLTSRRSHDHPITISVGASPTCLSIQNILDGSQSSSTITSLKDTISRLKTPCHSQKQIYDLELHAGVYPIFDLQQQATHARSPTSFPSSSKENPYNSISLSILSEICSLYPQRTSSPEALCSAGTLALAREPCKSYPGWGIVMPWNMPPSYHPLANDRKGIMVGRVSQEHGILGWIDRSNQESLPLEYGQKVRIWANHACITLAGYRFYFVVDSQIDSGEEVVDVWVPWRGW